MILNLGSLAFNANIAGGGGTPAWGTELGQGEGYKFVFEDMSDFFTGMVYNAVPDIEEVTCPLGKGGNQRSDYDFSIASLFDKVYVNGKRVENAQFLLLVVKKIVGNHHVGRRTLKYNPRMTYRGLLINDDCYNRMATTLGYNSDAAWFVHEINIKQQDELHFTAYILGEEPKSYYSNDSRRDDFISKLPKNKEVLKLKLSDNLNKSIQQIFYGAPGTGKSHTIERDTAGEDVIRTTFHPDTDYSSFVGAYKPTTIVERVMTTIGTKAVPVDNEDGSPRYESKIIYEFVCQSFLQAYIDAWKKFADASKKGEAAKKQFLVIEEINRGNCAQIFGDLFQLLDRNCKGFSDYPITADADMQKQLRKQLKGLEIDGKEEINAMYRGRDVVSEVLAGKIMLLPNNLYIWATMNTSDQSLFPIDSAFKRRWNWQYIPISNRNKGYKIVLNEAVYDWWQFLEKINSKIWDNTHSEDKKLGYFFVKADDGNITADIFVGKVIFYLWNDVFKDFIEDNGNIFKDADGSALSFDKFYATNNAGETKVVEEKVQQFLTNLELEPEVLEEDNAEQND